MTEVVYTVEEVAKLLKVSEMTVRRMIEDGQLACQCDFSEKI